MQVRRRIQEDVESGVEKQQREYILRRQLESIRKELGEDEGSVIDEYRTKITEAEMPEAVAEQAESELSRLERMGEQSPEASVIRNYLDWLLAVPWSKRSEERLDPKYTREVLDADHAGLEDVKDRIVEYIAVEKLRKERGIEDDKRSGAILTLIGPPGTGKTSIGESIARATGREFVRMEAVASARRCSAGTRRACARSRQITTSRRSSSRHSSATATRRRPRSSAMHATSPSRTWPRWSGRPSTISRTIHCPMGSR